MPTKERLSKIERVVSNRQSGLIVVIEDIHDPHNAEAIMRTCDAFGVQNVYWIFDQEKYYNPKRVGAASSSSANKWLDFKIFRSSEACFKELKKKKYQIVATILDEKAKDIFQYDLINKNLALVIGNEHRGISKVAQKYATTKLYIPMRGMVQSLNVSVTAAICLFEITRQRMESGKTFELNNTEHKRLIKSFCKK